MISTKNVKFTLVSAAWMGSLLGALVTVLIALIRFDPEIPIMQLSPTTLIEISDQPLPDQTQDIIEKTLLVLVVAGLYYLFVRVWQRGQRWIRHKFSRFEQDYRKASEELTEVMTTNVTMADLAHGMVEKLAQRMRLNQVSVLLFRDENLVCCRMSEASGEREQAWQQFCSQNQAGIRRVFRLFRSESWFNVNYLTDDIKDSFADYGFKYVFLIRSKGNLVGAILIGDRQSELSVTLDDQHFIASIAKQAATAVERVLLYEELADSERVKRELEIARHIQLDSLPQVTPRIEGLDISGISLPSTEVGGDFFDYLNGSDRGLSIVVGDVSGKGTSAALYMAKVQGILRSLSSFGLSPRELLIRANQLLCGDLDRRSFVTAIATSFESSARVVNLSRAGHLPLFFYRDRMGVVERVSPPGLGLALDHQGAFDTQLQEHKLNYEPGDILVFVTDGVTEAQNRALHEFGEEKLIEVMLQHAGSSAVQIRDAILRAIDLFAADSPQNDDRTIVVVKAV